jgi:hypothetical protein
MALALAACIDTTGPVREPNVTTIVITRGTQTVSVDIATQVCTGCPLIVNHGATVTAQFLGDDGEPDPVATRGDFRLNVVIPGNPVALGFTLNPANLFSGMFTATGTTGVPINVTFELWHLKPGHGDGAVIIPVIVQ